MRRAHTAALVSHDQPDILQAIELYATVLASTKHWFTYGWTLEEFLKRGIPKFLPEVQPLTRVLWHRPNGNSTDAPERDPEASHRRAVDMCLAMYKRARQRGMSQADARDEAAGVYPDDIVLEAIGAPA